MKPFTPMHLVNTDRSGNTLAEFDALVLQDAFDGWHLVAKTDENHVGYTVCTDIDESYGSPIAMMLIHPDSMRNKTLCYHHGSNNVRSLLFMGIVRDADGVDTSNVTCMLRDESLNEREFEDEELVGAVAELLVELCPYVGYDGMYTEEPDE